MDRILLNKMEFYGYHGVFPEENRLGQRFIIDLVVEADLQKAGKEDNLEESINYGELFQVCKEIVEGKPLNLIEAVAEKISATILQQYTAVRSTTVKVIKPDPPIPGHYQSVAVEITRGRKDGE
ncbi:dihydroneopterin aldolase [Bacillus sp. 03113]|uniref:dihydroneopterin aldolase n=1 Tax=Bacillus sp. 03113 TaxID=2578211 RepID=UPI0011443BDA|nr:dihydroneopterin aldolase [Bacillus sp. 03113]